ncbi:MAG: flagellar protein FlgN [Negativicutes bacterium]|nr:flagellar protein FlgN [Negativicutes bacterium]
MKELWERLGAILTEMLDRYKALLALSKLKREVLVNVKVQELETLVKQEEAIILQVGKLEGLREQTVTEIAQAYRLVPASLTLAKVRELAAAAYAERFAAIDRELGQTLAELTPLNKLNAELIQQSLGFINYNLNLLSQSQAGPTYAPKGQTAPMDASRVLIDRKV